MKTDNELREIADLVRKVVDDPYDPNYLERSSTAEISDFLHNLSKDRDLETGSLDEKVDEADFEFNSLTEGDRQKVHDIWTENERAKKFIDCWKGLRVRR